MKLSTIVVALIVFAAVGCNDEGGWSESPNGGDADTDSDGDSDGDGDTDTDSDADGDTDADVDADTDGDSDADADADNDGDSDGDGDLAPCEPNCPKLVWKTIAGGSFEMGDEDGDAWEKPIHNVDIASFSMTKSEITVVQYQSCVDFGQWCGEPDPNGYCADGLNWGAEGRENHPVNCVKWEWAKEYCLWVGGRLPSEAEWEFAASSRGTSTYPWGGIPPSCDFCVMDDEDFSSDGCGDGHTWDVCSKSEGNSDQGLCDMSGNVFEYCMDEYHDSYDGAPTDGSPWDEAGMLAVTRGGDFTSGAHELRSTYRSNLPTQNYNISVGFRCARDGASPDGDVDGDSDGDGDTDADADTDCIPKCSGKDCGPDGCGDLCGECLGETEWCNASQKCVDDCASRECGESPIMGFDCGNCEIGAEVCSEGTCVPA